jgi:hypothetical protein
MPDTYQVLADGIGALNNPLATYDTQEAMPQGQKRGAFQVKSIVSRTSTSFVVQYELIDWVYIPQLLGLDCENELGLTRQSQIVINDTFNFDASRVISHAVSPRTTLTSVSCIMSDQPDLTVKYISVPRELLPQGVLRYKHLKLERFVSAPSGTLAANGVTTITSNNIQLQRVPRYVWFFVREADQNMTRESSNTFCALQAGTYINFNNQGALLSTARLEDWWMMARDCGLQDSYEEFAGLAFGPSFANVGTMGSVGCVQFGRHISLGQGLQIGQAGTFNFNMSVNVMNVNQNSAITTPTLYIIVGYDHEMVISEGGDVSFELPVTPVGMVGSADELIKMPAMVGGALEHRGAGFFDWLQKAHDWIKENKIISKVSGALSSVPLLASVVGPINAAATHLGYSERARGGKAMSREELRQAIKDL